LSREVLKFYSQKKNVALQFTTGKSGPHFETGDHLDEAYFEAGNAAGPFVINN
jgi:hypothetical protein